MPALPILHPHTRLGHIEGLEGVRMLERKLEVLANNVANSNTPGFKKERLTFEEYYLDQLDASKRTAKGEIEATDFSQGGFKQTNNPLDLAIDGEGFFAVETPFGKAFTRAGHFTLNASNELVTPEGYKVLGNGGPITLEDTTGKGVWVNREGHFYVDETEVAALDIVAFDNPDSLKKIGRNLFSAEGTGAQERSAQGKVAQGFIEDSNVNPVESMVVLIDLYRAYEAMQRAMQACDELDDKAINQVGKVG